MLGLASVVCVCICVCVIVIRLNFLYHFIVFMLLPYAKYTILYSDVGVALPHCALNDFRTSLSLLTSVDYWVTYYLNLSL